MCSEITLSKSQPYVPGDFEFNVAVIRVTLWRPRCPLTGRRSVRRWGSWERSQTWTHGHHPHTRPTNMMTSSQGNALHIAGPLWGESIGARWIPLTKGQKCGAHGDAVTLSTLLSLWEGNPTITSGFSSQKAINAEVWCFIWRQLCFLTNSRVALIISTSIYNDERYPGNLPPYTSGLS